MVYTERGILKRSVSIMMTNFLKWKHDYVFALFLSDLRSDIDTSDHIQTILGKCGSKYLGGRCRCFKFVYGKPDIFKRCASDYISRFCPVDDLWDCMAVFYGNWLFDICGEPAVWKV